MLLFPRTGDMNNCSFLQPQPVQFAVGQPRLFHIDRATVQMIHWCTSTGSAGAEALRMPHGANLFGGPDVTHRYAPFFQLRSPPRKARLNSAWTGFP